MIVMIPQPSYYTDVNLRHLRNIFRKSHSFYRNISAAGTILARVSSSLISHQAAARSINTEWCYCLLVITDRLWLVTCHHGGLWLADAGHMSLPAHLATVSLWTIHFISHNICSRHTQKHQGDIKILDCYVVLGITQLPFFTFADNKLGLCFEGSLWSVVFSSKSNFEYKRWLVDKMMEGFAEWITGPSKQCFVLPIYTQYNLFVSINREPRLSSVIHKEF